MIKKLFVPIFILCAISCDQTSFDVKKGGGPKNDETKPYENCSDLFLFDTKTKVHTYNEDGSLSSSIYL